MADPIADYTVRFDEQGRPFNLTRGGQRSYLSPIMAAEYAHMFVTDPAQRAAVNAGMDPTTLQRLEAYARQNGVTAQNPLGNVPKGGFVKGRGEWNPGAGQYDQHLNQGGLGGLIEGAAAVAAPMFLGPLATGSPTIFGGGGAATAGGANSTVAPGVVNLATPASTAAAGPTAATGGAAATGGWEALKRAFNSPADFAKLIPLIPAIRAAAGGGSPTGGDSGGLIDDVRQSLAMQRDRMTQAQPVYDALIRQAMGTTPTRYRAGAPTTTGGAGYAYTPPTFGGR